MSDFGKNVTGAELQKLAADTIRIISAEGVQAAKSGHPGLPMGAADMAHVLWSRFLKVNPADPKWINRDRFVLSAGHGSMLIYSLLHLAGFDLPMEELKNFRQWNSLTPGHPEYGHTAGVDMTAGPLGAGFASAVGMALAERMLAARMNTEKHTIIDHFTYTLMGDGCNMEGVTSEAASLAGHLKLGKLIAFYDDNEISIEGCTDLAFTENVPARYKAYDWQVIDVADGHDHEAIAKAVKEAQAETEKPSLIVCHTTIGKGSPHKAGTHGVHGEPLGDDEMKATKEALGWPVDSSFLVPESVTGLWQKRQEEWKGMKAEWQKTYDAWKSENADKAENLERARKGDLPADFRNALKPFETGKSVATRSSGGEVLNQLAAAVPELVGGSADLAPSTKTELKGLDFVAPGNYSGRNIHFGVREHAMGSIANGMALHGAFLPFCATFMVFSDYMRPPMRLAALMSLRTIFYFTHDSIFVGEDGPTHQPVEHLASMRIIPNLWVMRPCDASEVSECLALACERKDGPTAFALSRQNLPTLDRSNMALVSDVAKGGYILKDCDGTPEVIIIATGSEVGVALEVQEKLAEKKVRVVSMPCMELFDAQDESYRESVLPAGVEARVSIEASLEPAWHKYVGTKGLVIGMEGFGASAPAEKLAEEFGFNAESVMEKMTAAKMA